MDQGIVSEAKELAFKAAADAGALARRSFGVAMDTTSKIHAGDLVTAVDRAAEEIILSSIKSRFPNHTVWTEEAPNPSSSNDWCWDVDPLDGTSNFVLGIPMYGVTLALSWRGTPLLGIVHDSHLSRTLIAEAGRGVELLNSNGRSVPTSPSAASRAVVAFQQGYEKNPRDKTVREILNELSDSYERVLTTWAPSIDTFLLLTGELDGIVGIDCKGYERPAWFLAAVEAGVEIYGVDGLRVRPNEVPESFVAAWRRGAPELRKLLMRHFVVPSDRRGTIWAQR